MTAPSPADDAAFMAQSRARYHSTLLDDVVPFWMRHGMDREFGGLSNVLDDHGHALSHDKFLWSQGRALWTFSTLCTRVEPRPEWLEFAHHLYRYLSTHGRDEGGRWMWRLDPQGRILERDTSIYVDGFVMSGLAAYYQATHEPDARRLALDTWANVRARLAQPGSYHVAPYAIPPGMKTQGISMIFSYFVYQLGVAFEMPDLREEGLARGQVILDDFYDPRHDAIVEFARLDGQPEASAPARTCVMGHAIEALWFLIAMFAHSGRPHQLPECCRLIRRHLELAWDEPLGGLMLARDLDGREPCYWQNPTCKPWWVHCEALVATAYAHRHTGDPWCLAWHRRIQDYAYAHYPVPTGEWVQWLTREGRPRESGGLPVKDPFHLPRALIELSDLFSA